MGGGGGIWGWGGGCNIPVMGYRGEVRQTDRQTDRDRQRQTYRQTDRQTDML